jgi:hypothetical protein
MYKAKGLRVVANDRLRYCYHIARAIIENNSVTVSDEELDALLKSNPKAASPASARPGFVEKTFRGKFFQSGVHQIIDNIRLNIDDLQGYKKDIALFALAKTSVSGSGGYGHFASTSRGSGNRHADTPKAFTDRFRDNIVWINSLVFDNGKENKVFCKGILGAGIAFALQEVVSSIAGWFAISFSNFFKTGDRIQLGGIKGDVIDIGILRTTIMEVGGWVNGDLYNGRVVRIANNFVFKEPVLNYSGDFPFLWDEITLPIRFGSDYDLARQLITEVVKETVSEYTEVAKKSWDELVKKYLIENAKVEPLISITVDENWVTFTIRYVVDYKSRRTTKDRLFARLLEEIEKNKDKISVASSSLDINVAK